MTSFWRWGIVVLICGFLLWYAQPKATPSSIDLSFFSIEKATTTAARAQGLSSHAPLTSTQGMLFVFDIPGMYSFWMKDMSFPIDIVWLDEHFNVINVTAHATPASYATKPPTTFRPERPAVYVLEMAAGQAAAHQIVHGIHIYGL